MAVIFTTGTTGASRERHIEGVPLPLTVTGPSVITGDTVTIEAVLGASRPTHATYSLSETRDGPAMRTSGERTVTQGFEAVFWNFTNVETELPTLWARVDYWTDPARKIRAAKAVPVKRVVAAPSLFWDDNAIWDDDEVWIEA